MNCIQLKMSKLLLFTGIFALLHFVRGQTKCDVPASKRQRCGDNFAASHQRVCYDLGCCFVPFPLNAIVRCYQPGVGSSPTNSNPFPRTNQFPPPFNRQGPPPLSSHWQPTSFPNVRNPPFGNYLQAGGEPGYEGSKLLQTCNRNRRWRRCGFGFIPPSRCIRMGCCFDLWSKKCFKSTYHITKLRNKCPPGFKNPPKCSDIDECQSGPCKNGGFCQNLINSFKCICPEPTRGKICTEVCRNPPVPEFGSISDDPNRPYDIDESVTFTCDATRELVGGSSTTCTDAGTWSNDAPTCKTVCRDPPVPVDGSISDTRTGPFDIGETVTFSCDGTLELFGDESTECTNAGMWSNDAPTCKIGCRDPPVPVDGSISDTRTGPFDIDETVTFSCDGTRVLIGPESAKCTAMMTWMNPDPPECIPACQYARYNFPLSEHTDHVRYTQTTPIPTLTKATACGWVKVQDHVRNQAMASYASTAEDNDFWMHITSASTMRLYVGGRYKELTINLPANTWAHICVWFDSTLSTPSVASFTNGMLSEMDDYPGTTPTGGGVLVLGQDQDVVGGGFGSENSLSGSIENFMLWDRVLSDEEIKNLATRCACPDDFLIATTLDRTTTDGGITKDSTGVCRLAS